MRGDYIRRVRLTPYRKGMGPTFTLTLLDGRFDGRRDRLSYCLAMSEGAGRVTLFEGDDFSPSPAHAWDSDECVSALLGFLTLRPGDTDGEYFDNYTPEQLAYCSQHAEALSRESSCRFGEW